jgi:stage II sporulation protein D
MPEPHWPAFSSRGLPIVVWGAYPARRYPVIAQMTTSLPTPPREPKRAHRARRQPERCSVLALAGALAALALLLCASAAQARTAATTITVTGRGWGHGIGMSQWGAYGYAKHGWTYQAILKHYYTGIDFGAVPNDPIRVRLRSGVSVVKLTCAKPYLAAVTGVRLDIDAGVTATVSWADGMYRVTAGDKSQTFTAPVTFTPSAGSLKLLTATDLGDAGLFRGVIRVLRPDSGFMIVNKLPLESYLRGVVPREVSPSWPSAALRAQACAARAYAQRSRNSGESYDVYCTTRDQVYMGVGVEASAATRAIRDTAGVVPMYDGKVISAFYFSTSGGHTENIENSWQTVAMPYLKGVDDPYDTYSPLHTWTPKQYAATTLAGKLGASVSGSLRAVYVVDRGVSPRIVKAAIMGSKGVQFLHGSILRSKLGLMDSWAFFRSMSISPAATDKVTIASDASIELKGEIFQAAPRGAKVTLHSYSNGAWHTRSVHTVRASESLGSGYAATYSTYSITLKPTVTTKYYFTYGKSRSPQTTVTVVPAPTPTPTPTSSGPAAETTLEPAVSASEAPEF